MRIGIIGAGQLGRMLALSGYPLGLRFTLLDPGADAPGAQVASNLQAAYDDAAALEKLASSVDVVTFEFENVPVAAVAPIAERTPFYPPLAALAASQDRIAEKKLFRSLKIPTPEFRAVDSLDELRQAVAAIGLPGVLKIRRLGYDGRGQHVLRQGGDLEKAWKDLGSAPLIYETFVPFDREVSIIGARSTRGEIACYPLSMNRHRDGILRHTIAPYRHAGLQKQAQTYLRRVLKHFDYAGVLTIEFFVRRGRLIANEMAPRVHNSGHWTIEGADTSQFENHLRAILGLPLGSTAARGHAAMINFIGVMPTRDAILGLEHAHLHHYGKEPRPQRKLGHATLVRASASARDQSLQRLLRVVK